MVDIELAQDSIEKDSIMKIRTAACLAASAALAATLSVAPAHAEEPGAGSLDDVQTLASGLAGPLRVAFGPDDSLLVAEAMGGMLTSVAPDGTKTTLVNAPGRELTGVSYARDTIFYFDNPAPVGEPPIPDPDTPALLKAIDDTGATRTVADLAAFERANDPDGSTIYGVRDASAECLAQAPMLQSHGELYSHPYSTAPARGGVYLGDAGANVILFADSRDNLHLVKTLPAEPIVITEQARALAAQVGIMVPDCMMGLTYWAQPVPTDIAVKGNWLYYTVLPGLPGEQLSAGKVYKMNLATGETTQVAGGLNASTGLALDSQGNIYVAELFGNGVSKLVPGGTELVLPAGLAADVAISGDRMAVLTDVLTPSGKLVTGTLK